MVIGCVFIWLVTYQKAKRVMLSAEVNCIVRLRYLGLTVTKAELKWLCIDLKDGEHTFLINPGRFPQISFHLRNNLLGVKPILSGCENPPLVGRRRESQCRIEIRPLASIS
jgi:hypothetical protein